MTDHDPRTADVLENLFFFGLPDTTLESIDAILAALAAAGLIVRPVDEWERVRLPLLDTGPSPVDGSNDAGRLADLWLFWDRGRWDIWHGQHAPTGARPLYVRKENPDD